MPFHPPLGVRYASAEDEARAAEARRDAELWVDQEFAENYVADLWGLSRPGESPRIFPAWVPLLAAGGALLVYLVRGSQNTKSK